MKEGNFITKYWLKKFEWYNWKFLIQLPLFIGYMWIVVIMIFVHLGLILLANILDGITNIKLMKKLMK